MFTEFEPCLVDGVKFAAYGNVAVTVWAQRTLGVTKALAMKDQLMSHLRRRYGERVVLIVVITEGNHIPDRKAFLDIEAFYQRWGDSLVGVVMVAEGEDLWSTAARAVMTALRLVKCSPFKSKICGRASEAAQWAAEYATAGGKSAAEMEADLAAAIEALRGNSFAAST